jgi:hypothetical protein
MKTVLEMAIEAELLYDSSWFFPYIEDTDIQEYIEKFAALVAAAEREACAGICDGFQMRDVGMQPAECAAAIRARGETKWTT